MEGKRLNFKPGVRHFKNIKNFWDFSKFEN